MRRGIGRLRAGGSGFNPLSLFAAGEQGAWYDASDMATLFQDSAGTTPVTATTQPVGKILDKSGRGNHLIQATGASRPTLQQDAGGNFYLSYDGLDDSYGSAATVDMSASDSATLWVGVRRVSDATLTVVTEFSAIVGNTNPGSFVLHGSNASANYLPAIARTATNSNSTTGAAAAPQSDVVSQAMNFGATGAAEISFILNATAAQPGSGGDAGTGNFGNFTLYLGRRNNTSLPFTGRMYQIILRGGASTAAQISQGQTFIGARMGISL